MNECWLIWVATWAASLVAVACVYALVWVPVSRAFTEAATIIGIMTP